MKKIIRKASVMTLAVLLPMYAAHAKVATDLDSALQGATRSLSSSIESIINLILVILGIGTMVMAAYVGIKMAKGDREGNQGLIQLIVGFVSAFAIIFIVKAVCF